jgi:hypothetical protein
MGGSKKAVGRKETLGPEKELAGTRKIHHGSRHGSTLPVAHAKPGSPVKSPDEGLFLDQVLDAKGSGKGRAGTRVLDSVATVTGYAASATTTTTATTHRSKCFTGTASAK